MGDWDGDCKDLEWHNLIAYAIVYVLGYSYAVQVWQPIVRKALVYIQTPWELSYHQLDIHPNSQAIVHKMKCHILVELFR